VAAQFGYVWADHGDNNKHLNTGTSQHPSGGTKRGRKVEKEHQAEKKRNRSATNSADVTSNKPDTTFVVCNQCGWRNHKTDECKLVKHKYANHDATKPWKDSEAAKASLKRGQNRLIITATKKGDSMEILNIVSNT